MPAALFLFVFCLGMLSMGLQLVASRGRSVFRQLDFRLGKSDHNVSGCVQHWIVRRRSSQREIRNPAAPDRCRVNVRLLRHASLQQSRILRSL